MVQPTQHVVWFWPKYQAQRCISQFSAESLALTLRGRSDGFGEGKRCMSPRDHEKAQIFQQIQARAEKWQTQRHFLIRMIRVLFLIYSRPKFIDIRVSVLLQKFLLRKVQNSFHCCCCLSLDSRYNMITIWDGSGHVSMLLAVPPSHVLEACITCSASDHMPCVNCSRMLKPPQGEPVHRQRCVLSNHQPMRKWCQMSWFHQKSRANSMSDLSEVWHSSAEVITRFSHETFVCTDGYCFQSLILVSKAAWVKSIDLKGIRDVHSGSLFMQVLFLAGWFP